MFAKFDFGAFAGVMRFENDASHPKKKGSTSTKAASKTGSKRKRVEEEEENEEEEEEYDWYNPRRSPTPEAFYIPLAQQPSAKTPNWNYRWRGTEQGEGEIVLNSEDDLYKITFGGPSGTKLSGTYGGTYFGKKVPIFTGEKVSMETPEIDIGYEWAAHNEHAWNRARVSRWH